MEDDKKTQAQMDEEKLRARALEMADDPKTQMYFDTDATDPDNLRDEMAKPRDQRKYYTDLADEDMPAWEYGWENDILGSDYGDNPEKTGAAIDDDNIPHYVRLSDEQKAERKARLDAMKAQREEEERKRQAEVDKYNKRQENKRRMKAMFGLD